MVEKIEDFVIKGDKEYLDLYFKADKTEYEKRKLVILKKQLDYIKEIWGL